MIEVNKNRREKLNMSRGAENLLKYLYNNKNKEGKYVVSTKKQLSQDYGLSLSTVSKRLKELENKRAVKLVTKRGANGGTIVNFKVQPSETFEEWYEKDENIVESESAYAKELRDKVFPKYERPLGNGRPRRTKEEMRAYRIAKDEYEKNLVNMNYHTLNYPSKNVFNMADDPEGYFRAYLLAKLYDLMCYKYMVSFRNHFKNKYDSGEKGYDEAVVYYENKANDYRYKNILGDNYFGERRFNIFYNLQAYLKEQKLEVHDFSYIREVFSNYTRSFENRRGTRKAFKSPVPYTNYLYSESAMVGYKERIRKGKRNRALYGFNSNIEQDISSVGSKSILYQSLKRLYDLGLEDSGLNLEELFNNTLTVTDIIKEGKINYSNDDDQLNRNSIVYRHYTDTVEKLKSKSMEEKEYETLIHYFGNLHMLLANPGRLSNINMASMFPVEQRYLIDKYTTMLGGKEEDSYKDEVLHSMMARMGHTNGTSLRSDSWVGKEIKESLTNLNWLSILTMYGDYRNITVNMQEVNHILNKYELIGEFPFEQSGVLSYDKILEEYIRKENLNE